MKRTTPKQQRRGGATTVEFMFVALLLLSFLFAIFEYARFLFVYHMTNNAARDAARFAVVRTGGGTVAPDNTAEPAAISTADVISVMNTGMFNGKRYGVGMNGVQNSITDYTVDVFAVPDSDLYATPPNLNPAGKPAWNTASFHQKIAVRVTGTYKPIGPNLIGMGSSITFNVVALAGSEAN